MNLKASNMETIFKSLGRLAGRLVYSLKPKNIAGVGFGILIVVVGYLMINNKSSQNNQRNSNTSTPPEKKICWSCGKDLSNTVDWIETDPKKYECTVCYEKTMREIKDDMTAEGYTK